MERKPLVSDSTYVVVKSTSFKKVPLAFSFSVLALEVPLTIRSGSLSSVTIWVKSDIGHIDKIWRFNSFLEVTGNHSSASWALSFIIKINLHFFVLVSRDSSDSSSNSSEFHNYFLNK